MSTVEELMSMPTSLTILVMGRPGIGKSTIVNGIVGENVATVSPPMAVETEGVTKDLRGYTLIKNNATITIWDTPGLLDSNIRIEDVLHTVKAKSNEVDLFFVCIEMTDTRFFKDAKEGVASMIRKIKDTLCKCIWKRTIIIFTKANMVVRALEDQLDTAKEIKLSYEGIVHRWKSLMTDAVGDSVDSGSLSFAFAGIAKRQKIFQTDETFWLSNLWEQCYNKVSNEGRAALTKVNMHRLTENATADDMTGPTLEKQPILVRYSYLKSGTVGVVAGAATGGAATGGGAAAAAAAAAAVGIATPIGWAILGGLGVGGALGGVLGGSLAYYKNFTSKCKCQIKK